MTDRIARALLLAALMLVIVLAVRLAWPPAPQPGADCIELGLFSACDPAGRP